MHRFTVLSCLLFLLVFRTAAQESNNCGTVSDPRFLNLLNEHRRSIAKYSAASQRTTTQIPVTVYIIRQSDGTGGISPETCDSLFEEMNMLFANAGVGFTFCGAPQFIDSDTYYEFARQEENSLVFQHHTPNTMNLYLPNSVTTPSGTALCGYAYYPGWKDVVVVDRHCAMDGSTLAHEIGHYLGLLHTHGNSNAQMTDELADFSNCLVAGDDICDTPADPMLSYAVDSNCLYIGNSTDAAGLPFDPETSNIMSYAPKPCRFQFTARQYDRMAYIASYLRDYLHCPYGSADFEVDLPVAFCTESHTVALSATGQGSAWEWDVDGDDIADYSGQYITHTYTGSGTYKVCLTTTFPSGVIKKCREVAVAVRNVHESPYSLPIEPDELVIDNPDNHHTWRIRDLGPNSGGQVIAIDNYNYNGAGQEDHFYVGPIDLSHLAHPVLKYKYAYASLDNSENEGLKLSMSTDCGQSFFDLQAMYGNTLNTAGNGNDGHWMPSTSADWQEHLIPLEAYGSDTVLLRFTNVNDFGNNLYLDEIELINDPVLGLEFLRFDVDVLPSGDHRLRWETTEEDQTLSYRLEYSINGHAFDQFASATPKRDRVNVYEFTFYPPEARIYYRIVAVLSDGKEISTGLRQVNGASERYLSIYPNPAQNMVTISGGSGFDDLMIIDQTGRPADAWTSGNSTSNGITVDISQLDAGLYSVVSRTHTGRFLKVE